MSTLDKFEKCEYFLEYFCWQLKKRADLKGNTVHIVVPGNESIAHCLSSKANYMKKSVGNSNKRKNKILSWHFYFSFIKMVIFQLNSVSHEIWYIDLYFIIIVLSVNTVYIRTVRMFFLYNTWKCLKWLKYSKVYLRIWKYLPVKLTTVYFNWTTTLTFSNHSNQINQTN